MTDRDVLRRASEALRESTEPSADELRALRQRVLGGQVVPLAHARKRKAMRWVLPLAAALVAGTALAATPGAWEGMLHGVERFLDVELLVPSHEAAPKAKPAKRKASAALSEPVAAAEPVGVEPVGVEPAPVEPVVEPRGGKAGTRTSTSTSTPTTTPMPTPTGGGESVEGDGEGPKGPSLELTLYKSAHALHFGAKRYADALVAWERYLALPSPTFALEARYNRAFCLLRLGHYEEARAALRPFAEGRVLGDYRRDEAQRLIQALDQRR